MDGLVGAATMMLLEIHVISCFQSINQSLFEIRQKPIHKQTYTHNFH